MIAFAGIGNPAGFLHTVRSLGMNVSAASWFDRTIIIIGCRGDLVGLVNVAQQRQIESMVTTLKDWVKLRGKALRRIRRRSGM